MRCFQNWMTVPPSTTVGGWVRELPQTLLSPVNEHDVCRHLFLLGRSWANPTLVRPRNSTTASRAQQATLDASSHEPAARPRAYWAHGRHRERATE
jgi:hypothetical protein